MGRARRDVPLERAAWETLRIKGVRGERLRAMFVALLAADPRFEVMPECIRFAEDPRETRPLRELTFTVVDTETTGTGVAHGHRLTEVAAVRVDRGRIVDRFESLLNPRRPIPPYITQLTGITDRMVAGAPDFETVAPELLDFIGDSVLVAHNAPFDRAFLDGEFARAFNRRLLTPFVCTVQLSRRVVPGLESYRLDSVAQHFGVSIDNRHRALGDAEATGKIFCRMLATLIECNVANLKEARAFRPENVTT
jgi:DNA polymerase-3 subunit epsilon